MGVTVRYFDELFDTEPDTTAISNTAIWLASKYLDSRRVTITMEHHGDKIALHKSVHGLPAQQCAVAA